MPNFNIEENIKKTFIKLMETRSIDEIDVQLLCSTLGITRQAFYYHFKNIYDVVLSIYEYDQLVLNPEDDEQDIISRFINYLFRREKMNREIANSSCEDVIKNYGFSYFYAGFAAFYENNHLKVDDKIQISRFLASALSNEILRLFKDENYRKQDIEEKVFRYLDFKFFKGILDKYK